MKIKTGNTKQMLPHLDHKLASERHITKKLAYQCQVQDTKIFIIALVLGTLVS